MTPTYQWHLTQAGESVLSGYGSMEELANQIDRLKLPIVGTIKDHAMIAKLATDLNTGMGVTTIPTKDGSEPYRLLLA